MAGPATPASVRFADAAVRLVYRVGWRLARAYWQVRRPSHRGALVAIWTDGRLLLVRQSYQPRLSFPGGGVEPGETPRQAACRELREELGLIVAEADLLDAGLARERWDGRDDTVWFFELHLPVAPTLRLDRREIVRAAFLAPQHWPARPSDPVAHYLARWRRDPARALSNAPSPR